MAGGLGGTGPRGPSAGGEVPVPQDPQVPCPPRVPTSTSHLVLLCPLTSTCPPIPSCPHVPDVPLSFHLPPVLQCPRRVPSHPLLPPCHPVLSCPPSRSSPPAPHAPPTPRAPAPTTPRAAEGSCRRRQPAGAALGRWAPRAAALHQRRQPRPSGGRGRGRLPAGSVRDGRARRRPVADRPLRAAGSPPETRRWRSALRPRPGLREGVSRRLGASRAGTRGGRCCRGRFCQRARARGGARWVSRGAAADGGGGAAPVGVTELLARGSRDRGLGAAAAAGRAVRAPGRSRRRRRRWAGRGLRRLAAPGAAVPPERRG